MNVTNPYIIGWTVGNQVNEVIAASEVTGILALGSNVPAIVNSMSDLFQDAVPDEYFTAVATIMLRANWHTYQVLTKRAERLKRHLGLPLDDPGIAEQ